LLSVLSFEDLFHMFEGKDNFVMAVITVYLENIIDWKYITLKWKNFILKFNLQKYLCMKIERFKLWWF